MFIRRRAQVERPQLPPTAHSARRHHRPVSSQLAGFWGPGMFEEKGLVGEAEAGVPDGAGSTIFGPQWSSVRCRAPVGRSRRESRGLAGDLFACSRPRGNLMPLYMYQASYTAKSMADQLKEPQDPVEVIRPALEELGATIVVAGFPFGEYDVLVVYEAPDDLTAASVAMAVAAAGEVRSGKTTRLLTGQEWLESLRKRRIVTSRKARQPRTSQS